MNSGGSLPRIRLYIAGRAPNSLRAVANLEALLQASPSGAMEVEIVDILSDPRRALRDGVYLTPMLVIPSTGQRIAGDLSKTDELIPLMKEKD
jgi:circadian clock protein KaiB